MTCTSDYTAGNDTFRLYTASSDDTFRLYTAGSDDTFFGLYTTGSDDTFRLYTTGSDDTFRLYTTGSDDTFRLYTTGSDDTFRLYTTGSDDTYFRPQQVVMTRTSDHITWCRHLQTTSRGDGTSDNTASSGASSTVTSPWERTNAYFIASENAQRNMKFGSFV